ncbi:hypothetical protein DH2020_005300 [Rehmannia glutinosa]|uniref:FBD domain-containing protein n=1 Tax=Rehmannia glutinosa TaxID=99300 RepID=A0ABR0XFQ6_REHGL
MEETEQSSRKRLKKVLDGNQIMPSSIDRLSGLPDAILIHILSFLPTKLSVATSILARRWRFLWAHVPNLDFDSETHSSESTTSFSGIIYRVMLLRKVQSINTFRLTYLCNCGKYELETWLATAIAGDVQKLDLYFPCNVVLPQCIFTCKTLVDMRLRGCYLGSLYFHVIISLPSLKKLHLSSVKFGNSYRNLMHFLSGSPVLEELIIDGIVDYDTCSYIICSPSIKRLMLNLQFDTYVSQSTADKVAIIAPSLRYFRLIDCLAGYIPGQRLSSLIEADVSFNNPKVVGEDYSYTLSVLRRIDLLCNVKYLKLSSGMVFNFIAFGDQSKPIRSFDNLTKLELDADCLFLKKFLESAENLQVLILREVHVHLKHWMEPNQVPKCLLSHLTTIRIDGMRCTQQEFDMVRYLLKNAQVLKRMEIYSRPDGIGFEAKFNALQRISLFHRGSVACELAFF